MTPTHEARLDALEVALSASAQRDGVALALLRSEHAALLREREALRAALEAAEQFIHPEIARGPAVNGWQNTVDIVAALLTGTTARTEGK